jgi:hypothetical protein
MSNDFGRYEDHCIGCDMGRWTVQSKPYRLTAFLSRESYVCRHGLYVSL